MQLILARECGKLTKPDDNCESMTTASGFTTTHISTADLTTLLEPVTQDLVQVELMLNTNMIDDTAFVGDLLSQIFQAGGKRLRPAIALLASRATARSDQEFSRLHIVLAVLTELIHTASLVHDDVIDSASLRRGKQTVNRRWNDKVAVLLGDLLFAQASICLARIMNPVIVGIYGQVLGDLCAGEIRQMRAQYLTTVNWDTYIHKSFCKTASLFAAASHSGAILNGCPNDTVESLKEYGRNLGILFQIVDDLLDVTGNTDQMGKEAGSDLQSGILTAPTLFILERGDSVSKALEDLIKTRAVNEPEGTQKALTIIRENGGVDKTVEMARKYGRAAKDCLNVIPTSPYKTSLEGLVDYILTRTT